MNDRQYSSVVFWVNATLQEYITTFSSVQSGVMMSQAGPMIVSSRGEFSSLMRIRILPFAYTGGIKIPLELASSFWEDNLLIGNVTKQKSS